jgi:phage FluMu protein Com
MSAHHCPKCKELLFHWYIDEEVTLDIQWACGGCGCRAIEKESLETNCPHCMSTNKSFVSLNIDGEHFKYFLSCMSKEAIKPW